MTKTPRPPSAAVAGDYLLYADSYWLAAKRLFNAQPLPGIPMPGLESHSLLPGLTLVCISIELSLKAVLVLNGVDDERMRKELSHDLVKAMDEAIKYGLFDNVEDLKPSKIRDDISYLSAIYKTPVLKYPHEPRTFTGRPEYLELAQFLVHAAAQCCEVVGLRSMTEPAFDGSIVGRITNSDTSGAGRFKQGTSSGDSK